MERGAWEPVTKAKLAAFAAGIGLLLVRIFLSEPGFVFALDHANLLFHEAGHPLIGLFSSRLEPYGGTVGQLFFPCALAVSFWRKNQPLGVAGGIVWFFENWLNIARYMADARKLELPLVGGGNHDWNTIFDRWDILRYDAYIAETVRVVGWIGMASAVAWVLWRVWLDHRRT